MSTTSLTPVLPDTVDVLIVGGGIQGAGIAQAAAAAGYNALLVEKTAWASGTSSKSSKLIHGGLRYLNQFQLGLVYESLRERQTLCRIAPHLVRLNNFYIPVYEQTRIRPWKLQAGLSLYALLGGLGRSQRFSRVPRRHWNNLYGLRTDGLQAVFQYQDAQTDDALLTRAVVASARQLGAHLTCPVEFVAATSTAVGYDVLLQGNGGALAVQCKVLINAAGPWCDQVADRITPLPHKPAMELVQGSHLVLNQRLSDECFYLESPSDGRAVFVLPWHDKSLLGTTETPYRGDPALAHCLPSEEIYLLDTLAHYFPEFRARVTVESRMAGLRVLPRSNSKFHSRSRDVMIHHHLLKGRGYIAVCGGKLTGYRSTASRVAGLLHHCLGKRPMIADTAWLQLPDS